MARKHALNAGGQKITFTTIQPGEPPDLSHITSDVLDHVGKLLREQRFPLTVVELQECFRRLRHVDDLLLEKGLEARGCRRFIKRHRDDLIALWNHTTRPELDNRCPMEVHIERVATGERGTPGVDNPCGSHYLYSDAEKRMFKAMRDGPPAWFKKLMEGGFTLTELLVSLSIVAILGALAVPALRSAMDRADRTVCLSNLRQLGQAFSEYTIDHGQYPAAELAVRDGSGRVVERRRWYHLIGPYLDSGPRAWSSGQGRAELDPVTGMARTVVLPSEDDRNQEVFSRVLVCPKAAHRDVGRNGCYGYNHQYLGDVDEMASLARLRACVGAV